LEDYEQVVFFGKPDKPPVIREETKKIEVKQPTVQFSVPTPIKIPQPQINHITGKKRELPTKFEGFPIHKRRKVFHDVEIQLIRKIECSIQTEIFKQRKWGFCQILNLSIIQPEFVFDNINEVMSVLIDNIEKYSKINIQLEDELTNTITQKERETEEMARITLLIFKNLTFLIEKFKDHEIKKITKIIINFLNEKYHKEIRSNSLEILINICKKIVFTSEDDEYSKNIVVSIVDLLLNNEDHITQCLDSLNGLLYDESQLKSNKSFIEKHLGKFHN
jgi:hypothetical protein